MKPPHAITQRELLNPDYPMPLMTCTRLQKERKPLFAKVLTMFSDKSPRISHNSAMVDTPANRITNRPTHLTLKPANKDTTSRCASQLQKIPHNINHSGNMLNEGQLKDNAQFITKAECINWEKHSYLAPTNYANNYTSNTLPGHLQFSS